MSRVLILSLVFPPDGVSTAQLLGSIAVDLEAQGHEVSVITTMPHYNRDPAAEARQPIRRSWLGGTSTFEGIPVRHLPMPRKSSSGVVRVAQWAWFHLASTLAAWRRRRPDVVMATSPPLTIGLNAWAAGRLGRVPLILNVWEIYPDIAVSLGYLSSPWAIRALSRLERATYRRAEAITVTSETARLTLVDGGRTDASKVHVVPNFVDAAPTGGDGFADGASLEDRFVVTYAGNMGPAQHIDDLITAARGMPDLDLLLVGGGSEWDRLHRLAEDVPSCTILPHQPFSAVGGIYGVTDIGVVPLARGVINEMPSKAMNLMGAGIPILAIADDESALAELVRVARCGVVVPPGRPDLVAEACTTLAGNPEDLAAIGANGRAYAEEHFARSVVMAAYGDLVTSVGR